MRVYIGLGSNLNQPANQIEKARLSINHLNGVEETGFSSLYRSRPMGPQDQPDYLNAVMEIETGLKPLELLDGLQAIESDQGRVRQGERWGARPIDLDILLYGEEILESERLTVPHPGIYERPFVLYPLKEISPNLIIPQYGALAGLVAGCDAEGLLKL